MADASTAALYELRRLEPLERLIVDGIPPGQGSWRRILEGVAPSSPQVRRAEFSVVRGACQLICVLESNHAHRLRQRLRARARRFGAQTVHEERDLSEVRLWCPSGVAALAVRCARALDSGEVELRQSWLTDEALTLLVAREHGPATLQICHDQAERWFVGDGGPR